MIQRIGQVGLSVAFVMFLLTGLSSPVRAGDVKTMDVEEIESGMKGYGLTVFEGTTIERFSLEVIDVMKNYFPRQDMILIEVDHKVTDHANIIGGMSGSPIYLYKDQENQKNPHLVGALAYGLVSFPKDPIAGVTPIQNMLDVKERPRESSRAPGKIKPKKEFAYRGKQLKRLGTYVTFSGVTSRVFRKFRERFTKLGLKPVRGGSGTGLQDEKGSIKPGAGVGIQLVTGDMPVSATGTVTYRDGEDVLVFGHPFLSAGEVEFPMTTAYVHKIMASQSSSYKLSSPIDRVGTITADRQAAVAGTYGKKPDLAPVNVRVKNSATGYEKKFNYGIIRNKFLSPVLLNMVASNSMLVTESTTYSFVTTEYEMKIETDNYGTIQFSNIAAGSPVGLFSTELQPLMNNPFDADLGIKNVSLDIRLKHENKRAIVQQAWLEKTKFSPGETATVHVRIRPYGKEPFLKTYDLQLPDNLPKGKYEFMVTPGDMAPRPMYQPENMDEYVKVVQKRGRADKLAISLKVPRVTLTSGAARLPNVPPSVIGAFVGNKDSNVLIQEEYIMKKESVSWVLIGSKNMKIEIE